MFGSVLLPTISSWMWHTT